MSDEKQNKRAVALLNVIEYLSMRLIDEVQDIDDYEERQDMLSRIWELYTDVTTATENIMG